MQVRFFDLPLKHQTNTNDTMKKVLIATANREIVQNLVTNKLNFTAETKNTSSFIISSRFFSTMVENAKIHGYNPFALFTW